MTWAMKSWWRARTRAGRFAVVLATILAFQLAVALSTEYTILPLMKALLPNDNWGDELGSFLLFFVQLLLCIPTLAALLISIGVMLWRGRRDRGRVASVVPRDSK